MAAPLDIRFQLCGNAQRTLWPVIGAKNRASVILAGKRFINMEVEVKGGDLNVPHVRNFLDCVKSRQRPNADVEEGHRTAVMCHLGNISTGIGRTLVWDAAQPRRCGG